MFNIYLNDEPQQIEVNLSLDELLRRIEVEEHFAVALNQRLVPRSAYTTTKLAAGDRVDIIVPMQGG